MVSTIASAAIAVVVDRAVAKFVDKISRQTAAAEKLQRLELLLIRIRSTIEVSEKHAIESPMLLRWQEKLKEAVSHGNEVLLSFQRRVDEAASHQSGNDQHASISAPSATMSFTRNALSTMAWHICTAATMLFSSDADIKKLDGAVEALDKASENILEFIALLQDLPDLKRRRTISMPSRFGTFHRVLLTSSKQRLVKMDTSLANTPPDDRQLQEVTVLVGRLQQAMAKITMSVEIAGNRNIVGLQWLTQWTDLLQEARQRGRTILDTARDKVGKETAEYDPEDDELRSFVHTIESLAGDLECFDRLTSLCPLN